jgi:hypothetical protein
MHRRRAIASRELRQPSPPDERRLPLVQDKRGGSAARVLASARMQASCAGARRRRRIAHRVCDPDSVVRLRRGTRLETPPRCAAGTRSDAGSRSGACPGKGILGHGGPREHWGRAPRLGVEGCGGRPGGRVSALRVPPAHAAHVVSAACAIAARAAGSTRRVKATRSAAVRWGCSQWGQWPVPW